MQTGSLSPSKRVSSIRDLGKQLADKYSDKYLKRINSIIRYSSSNSWRSSLTSFSSKANSLLSKLSTEDKSSAEEARYSPSRKSKSQVQMEEPVASNSFSLKHRGRREPSNLHSQKTMLFTLDEMEPQEIEVWKELINEEKVGAASRPLYLAVSPLNRKCCVFRTYSLCPRCGFTPEHRLAVTCGQMDSSSENSFVNRSDFYGNTPLHCAAAAVVQDGFCKIRHRSLLWPGVEVSCCNTIGETFLHILCRHGPRTKAILQPSS